MAEESDSLTVALTGAAGYLGSSLLRELTEDSRVERVLAFDVRPPRHHHSKIVFDQVDVRDPALESRLAGCDVVVHLAFIMDPIHDESKMRDVNVNGTQNVFRCAGAAGVKKIVYTSSAVAYGAHPNNPIPLTEDAPLRANLDFNYAAHKLEAEYVVKEFREEFPDVVVTVFRPAIVFGPGVDNAWSHAMQAPFLLGVQGYHAPLQFVHEEDVVEALRMAVFESWDGPYNLAADGSLDPEEILTLLGRRRFDLPEPVVFAMLDRMWARGMAEAPAGMLHYVMHPWVVSVDKLAAAGFVAKRSNWDTFEEVAQRMKGRVRLGRRTVSTSAMKGTLAGLGLIGALGAARYLRKGTT